LKLTNLSSKYFNMALFALLVSAQPASMKVD